MSGEPVNLEDIQSIIKLIRDAENVAEFSLKYGELEISLSRNSTAVRSAEPRSPSSVTRNDSSASQNSAAAPSMNPTTIMGVGRDLSPMAQRSEPQEGEIAIKAPMVGTFYRSPKPGDPPFVEEGHAVGTDSIVCIIEVMKLMNSLHAGIEGVVTRILVQDAQAVEYGQPLMFVRKSAA